MTTLLVACPYAVNLRNLFLTDSYPALAEDADLRLVCLTTMDPATPALRSLADDRVAFERIGTYDPGRVERMVDHFSRLLFLPSSAIMEVYYQPHLDRNPVLRAILKTLWAAGAHRSRGFIRALRGFRSGLLAGRRYDEIIRQYRPDLVATTRLFNTDEYRLLAAAKRSGVPTVHLVASWDNLTSYAYLPFWPDYLWCWNPIMTDEACRLHAFPRDRTEVVGPPQFDIYFRPETYPPRAEYLARLGLDAGLRLITFTTTDILSDQPALAERIWKAVIADHPDRQLLVRVHPQEDAAKYDRLRELARLVLDVPGSWAGTSADRLFSRQDFLDLACCMTFSDVVINVCSTITLDASAADTPIICYRNLEAYTDRAANEKMIEAHDRTHFAPLKAAGGLTIAATDRELAELVAGYLEDSTRHADRRRILTDLMIPRTDGGIGRHLGRRLGELARHSAGLGG
jgi:hypothetical protein